jgi:UDP-N-acetyl-D-mannosaminuronate dehydrogenase
VEIHSIRHRRDGYRTRGPAVAYHDPYVTEWQVDGEAVPRAGDLPAAVAAADLVILLQPHQDYNLADIARTARLMLDTRGVASAAPHVEAL